MNPDERGFKNAKSFGSICVYPRLSAANLVFDFFRDLLARRVLAESAAVPNFRGGDTTR
jgi:hypothetical protein